MKPKTKSLLKLIFATTILGSLLIAGGYCITLQAKSLSSTTTATYKADTSILKERKFKNKINQLSPKERIIISELKNMEGGYKYDNTPVRNTGNN